MRAVLICSTRRGQSSVYARASLRFCLFLALLDDLVSEMMVEDGGNTGGTDSIGVAGIGIGSAESDDEIVRENTATAVALCEIGLVVGAAVARRIREQPEQWWHKIGRAHV